MLNKKSKEEAFNWTSIGNLSLVVMGVDELRIFVYKYRVRGSSELQECHVRNSCYTIQKSRLYLPILGKECGQEGTLAKALTTFHI